MTDEQAVIIAEILAAKLEMGLADMASAITAGLSDIADALEDSVSNITIETDNHLLVRGLDSIAAAIDLAARTRS